MKGLKPPVIDYASSKAKHDNLPTKKTTSSSTTRGKGPFIAAIVGAGLLAAVFALAWAAPKFFEALALYTIVIPGMAAIMCVIASLEACFQVASQPRTRVDLLKPAVAIDFLIILFLAVFFLVAFLS